MENILVLGSRCRDGEPGSLLASRLERALSLIDDAPSSTQIVVSGLDEAPAMRSWLVSHGVPASRIVLEPRATSTNENLENATALLPETTRWIVVTSDFHSLRTRMWAHHLGIPVRVVTARTPSPVRLKQNVREVGAVVHSGARILWRKVRSFLVC